MPSKPSKKTVPTWLLFIKEHKKYLIFLLCTFFLYLAVTFLRVLIWQPDGLYTSFDNAWGDWPLHIAMTNTFAYHEPSQWFLNHPAYAGAPLHYYFLSNFISGMLIRVGFSLYAAMVIPSLLYSFVIVFGLYLFLGQLLSSKKQAVLATSFFFLSSGPGFLSFLSDVFKKGLSPILFPLITDYGEAIEYDWLAANFVDSILVPQRAFLLGLALCLTVLNLLYFTLTTKKTAQNQTGIKKILFTAGCLAGVTVLAQIHSFITLVIVAGLLCAVSYKRWKELLFFVVPAGVISSLLYFNFLNRGIENPTFMEGQIGWSAAGKGFVEWVVMWLKIWGSMLPLAAIGAYTFRTKSVHAKTTIVGLAVVFGIANLFRFQPFLWDNSKFFAWSYIGFSALVAHLLALIWRKEVPGKILALFLIFTLTVTGFLELYRLATNDVRRLQISNADDIQLGLTIRKETDPSARFLTDTNHNNWVMMWGTRPIVLGYTGWVYSHGLLYSDREQDVLTMFRGGQKALELLKNYQVSYVVIGPGELRNQRANEAYFASTFPLAFSNTETRIYDVRQH
jgi:hypothetical protein